MLGRLIDALGARGRANIRPPRVLMRCRTAVALRSNRLKSERRLEIGPGVKRLTGFETLNIWPDWHTDYLCNASGRLPFEDETFILVYASHVLEHIPWYQAEAALTEWRRILKPGGGLEVWVPDGLKICKALVEAEENGRDYTHLDGWYKFNPEKDPCVWAAGRLFTYGDGKGRLDHPNWHRAIFTARYLKALFEKVGLTQIRELTQEEVRGHDHGWISLGVVGVKP
jgi:predicted SAM-dependent methyltransferase